MTVDELIELLAALPGNAIVRMHSWGNLEFSNPEHIEGPTPDGEVVIHGD